MNITATHIDESAQSQGVSANPFVYRLLFYKAYCFSVGLFLFQKGGALNKLKTDGSQVESLLSQ